MTMVPGKPVARRGILEAARRRVKKQPSRRFAQPPPSPTPRVSGARKQQSY